MGDQGDPAINEATLSEAGDIDSVRCRGATARSPLHFLPGHSPGLIFLEIDTSLSLVHDAPSGLLPRGPLGATLLVATRSLMVLAASPQLCRILYGNWRLGGVWRMSRPWRPSVMLIVAACTACTLATSTTIAPVFSATPVLPTICDSTPTIIPGAAIGGLLLGMSFGDAQKLLPMVAPSDTSQSSGTYQGETWSLRGQPGVGIIAKEGRLVKINLARGGVHTVLTADKRG